MGKNNNNYFADFSKSFIKSFAVSYITSKTLHTLFDTSNSKQAEHIKTENEKCAIEQNKTKVLENKSNNQRLLNSAYNRKTIELDDDDDYITDDKITVFGKSCKKAFAISQKNADALNAAAESIERQQRDSKKEIQREPESRKSQPVKKAVESASQAKSSDRPNQKDILWENLQKDLEKYDGDFNRYFKDNIAPGIKNIFK